MPLSPFALVSAEDAMRECDAPDADYLEVEDLVNAATSRIEAFCQQMFVARPMLQTFDGDGSIILDLRSRIVSIKAVSVYDTQLLAPGTSQTGLDDYRILHERGELYRAFGWVPGVRNIVVEGTLGWGGIAAVPIDVRRACMMLVKYWYKHEDDLATEKLGEYTYTRFAPQADDPNGDLPPKVQGILRARVRWHV